MTKKSLRKRMDEHLHQTCDEMGYPLNGSEPIEVPYGTADAETGSESWAYWQHLGMRTKTPLNETCGDFRIRNSCDEYAKRFHNALDTGFWKLTKAPNGKPWKCFEDYLKCPTPWGVGLGKRWDNVLVPMLSEMDQSFETDGYSHVGIVDRIKADKLGDARSGNGGDHKSQDFQNQSRTILSEIDRDHASEKELGRQRAFERAPKFIQDLASNKDMSFDLATRFGPYIPAHPTEKQRQNADSIAAAAADVERWHKETPYPVMEKDVAEYRRQLRAVAMESLGRTKQGFYVFTYKPERLGEQLIKHVPTSQLIELVELLAKRLQAGGEA